MINERYEIQKRLDKEILKKYMIGNVLGGAIGKYNMYIDLIIYDEDTFIKKAKILLSSYNRNFYLSQFTQYSNIKNIFSI